MHSNPDVSSDDFIFSQSGRGFVVLRVVTALCSSSKLHFISLSKNNERARMFKESLHR
jgi:hypothetical protein